MLPILPLSTTLLLSLLQQVHGAPFYFLSNNRQKCVSVVSPPGGITLVIEYFAPDMVLKEDLIAQDSRLLQMQKDLEENKKVGSEADRLKSEFESSVQQLQRSTFRGQPQDMKIIVMERPNRSTPSAHWKERRQQQQEEAQKNGQPVRKPSGRLIQGLETQRGNVTYVTTFYGGHVDICMQSMSATAERPSRYSLTVQSEDDVLSRQSMMEEMKMEIEQVKEQEKEASQKQAHRHLTRFQADLLGMDRKLTMILNNADDAKGREKEFQSKSIQMNRAALYWPAIHIVVLVIAGFTQVNHMISYLKSRHLY